MASSKEWFESVEEARRRARKRLPKGVYMALEAGAEEGVSRADNTRAFGELGLVPRIATGIGGRAQAATVLGTEVALPVLISPTGVQAVHPDGEVAVARAAAAADTAIGLSSFASKPIEEVVAANPKTFFQVYWLGDRSRIEAILGRAREAGAAGLIVTIDWTFAHRRDWGSPRIPQDSSLKSMLPLLPEALARPRWLLSYLRRKQLPTLTTPNLTPPGGEAPTFFGAYGEWIGTPQPSWEDLAWLREAWGGPFMVKGVHHPEDARRAVAIGADAISVSNHGGNNLDGTPAPVRVLPAVAEAVGGEVEILLDGGVRRGSDAVKARALGARAVMVGRPYLWGLGANGEAGVANVLEIFRAGVDEALLGLGRSSIDEVGAEDVLVPDGFRSLVA
ncbi:MAG: pre-mycofactocin synthase MftD [Solirubrobacterales bacterium]